MELKPDKDDFSLKENLFCIALAVVFLIAFVSWLVISYSKAPIN